MKKTEYIVPQTLVVMIQGQELLNSISSVSGANGLGVGGNTSDEDITSGNSKSSSNWSNIWD